MKNTKYYNISDSLLDDIINCAYRNAPLSKRIKIFFLRKKHSNIEVVFYNYRITANSAKKLSEEKCPSSVLKSTADKTKTNVISQQNFWEDLYSLYMFKPALSLSVVILITAGILFSLLRDSNSVQYSRAEIELANKQAKEALYIVSSIFSKTSSTLTRDILPVQVSERINQGVNVIEDLFKENKNETIN